MTESRYGDGDVVAVTGSRYGDGDVVAAAGMPGDDWMLHGRTLEGESPVQLRKDKRKKRGGF